MSTPANTQSPRDIDLDALQVVLGCANSHVEDIESGIEEGIYSASENSGLPAMQQAVKTLEDWHAASAASSARKPQIYAALEFSSEFDGKRTYTTYHVSATSNQDAMTALNEDGVNSKLLFIANRDGHGRHNAVEQLTRHIERFVSEPDFQLWLELSTRPSFEDGEEHPASWIQVPYIELVKAASIPA